MWDFLKRFLGYSTQTEPVAPYKVEAPVVAAPVEQPKKVVKPRVVKATPAITAKPKAAPKAKTPKK